MRLSDAFLTRYAFLRSFLQILKRQANYLITKFINALYIIQSIKNHSSFKEVATNNYAANTIHFWAAR